MNSDSLERIRSKGWTQGSIFERPSEGFLAALLEEHDLWVVASHPCDVVARDFEREPLVEIVPADRVLELDGNFTFGANPRRLHVRAIGTGLELDLAGKLAIDRIHLAELQPSGVLAGRDARTFPQWLAGRYARSFFADEFNERRSAASKKVNQALKKSGADVTGIYVAVQDEELPSDEAYEISLLFTVLPEVDDDIERMVAVNEMADIIVEQYESCQGLRVTNSDVQSELNVPISALRSYRRLDFDHYTIKGDEVGDEPTSIAV